LFEELEDVEVLQERVLINGAAWPIQAIREKDIFSMKFQREKKGPKGTRKN
jgi:hypothetical protein